jgi:hypothetical protein
VTEDERKVMEILINHPPTTDVWREPIQAVGKAMQLDDSDAREFVHPMFERRLLRIRSKAINLPDPADVKSEWWEKGEKAD